MCIRDSVNPDDPATWARVEQTALRIAGEAAAAGKHEYVLRFGRVVRVEDLTEGTGRKIAVFYENSKGEKRLRSEFLNTTRGQAVAETARRLVGQWCTLVQWNEPDTRNVSESDHFGTLVHLWCDRPESTPPNGNGSAPPAPQHPAGPSSGLVELRGQIDQFLGLLMAAAKTDPAIAHKLTAIATWCDASNLPRKDRDRWPDKAIEAFGKKLSKMPGWPSGPIPTGDVAGMGDGSQSTPARPPSTAPPQPDPTVHELNPNLATLGQKLRIKTAVTAANVADPNHSAGDEILAELCATAGIESLDDEFDKPTAQWIIDQLTPVAPEPEEPAATAAGGDHPGDPNTDPF